VGALESSIASPLFLCLFYSALAVRRALCLSSGKMQTQKLPTHADTGTLRLYLQWPSSDDVYP
jgi:hypothetical protein